MGRLVCVDCFCVSTSVTKGLSIAMPVIASMSAITISAMCFIPFLYAVSTMSAADNSKPTTISVLNCCEVVIMTPLRCYWCEYIPIHMSVCP